MRRAIADFAGGTVDQVRAVLESSSENELDGYELEFVPASELGKSGRLPQDAVAAAR